MRHLASLSRAKELFDKRSREEGCPSAKIEKHKWRLNIRAVQAGPWLFVTDNTHSTHRRSWVLRLKRASPALGPACGYLLFSTTIFQSEFYRRTCRRLLFLQLSLANFAIGRHLRLSCVLFLVQELIDGGHFTYSVHIKSSAHAGRCPRCSVMLPVKQSWGFCLLLCPVRARQSATKTPQRDGKVQLLAITRS